MDIRNLQNHLVGLPLFADIQAIGESRGGGGYGRGNPPFQISKIKESYKIKQKI